MTLAKAIPWVLVFLCACHHPGHPKASLSPFPDWRTIQGNIESDHQIVPDANAENIVSFVVCYPLPKKIDCKIPPLGMVQATESKLILIGAKSAGSVMYEGTLN